MNKRDIWRRANAPAIKDAERYANSVSPIRFAPSATSQERTIIENERIREGKCMHGKFPRLVAEGLSKLLGFKVKGCNRCA